MIHENGVSCIIEILQPYHRAIVYLRIHCSVTTLVELLIVVCGQCNKV